MNLEARFAEWAITRLGHASLQPKERAIRTLEETVELCQAEGITEEMVHRQVAYVFSRPPGKPDQEAAGIAVCLLGWCYARGHRLKDLAIRELERIEAKPVDQIRGSLARKADADLVQAIEGGGTGTDRCSCLKDPGHPYYAACCLLQDGHPGDHQWESPEECTRKFYLAMETSK